MSDGTGITENWVLENEQTEEKWWELAYRAKRLAYTLLSKMKSKEAKSRRRPRDLRGKGLVGEFGLGCRRLRMWSRLHLHRKPMHFWIGRPYFLINQTALLLSFEGKLRRKTIHGN